MKNILSTLLLFFIALAAANAATYTVINANDNGPGSLREAINLANSGADPDNIHFNIPGAGPHEINLLSPLPALMYLTHIYGYSQPGAAVATASAPAVIKIALNGAAAGAGAAGLTISGNYCHVSGLAIYGFDSGMVINGHSNDIAGCYIGLDATGLNPIGNASDGMIITGLQNKIGRTAPFNRNVISGNANGIVIFPFAHSNLIEGNYIGTDATGNTTIPNNGSDGIAISSSNNKILNNVIVGHSSNNVLISQWANGFPLPSINLVQGNRIGHHADGSFSSFASNCQGVSLNNARNTTITENIIFGNGCQGVLIGGDAAAGNLVSNNSIYGNSELAINLGFDGVTPNDPGDADMGPNGLQNFPVLESAKANASKTKVKGFINTPNPASVNIEFYTNPSPHPTGHGDGQTLIGVATPKNNGKIRANLPPVAPGTYLSAIAIDRENNTSEFSMSIEVTGPGGDSGATSPGSPQAAVFGDGNEEALQAGVFPNPFSGEVTITYRLPKAQPVHLSVFHSNGQLVRVLQNGFQAGGSHQVRFNAQGLPAGMYFFRLVAGGEVHGGKMILK